MNKALVPRLGVSYTNVTKAIKMSDLPLEAFHSADGHTAEVQGQQENSPPASLQGRGLQE